ncbi:hypothetical protein EDB87DRAFT_1638597 [Lactarius vividus]|nr:hypothetical protein EDB87DRAFT_1638597 [Lactarius vividus]
MRLKTPTDDSPEEVADHTTLCCRGRQRPREGVKALRNPRYPSSVPYFSPSKHLPLDKQRRYWDLRSCYGHLSVYRNSRNYAHDIRNTNIRMTGASSYLRNAKWRQENRPAPPIPNLIMKLATEDRTMVLHVPVEGVIYSDRKESKHLDRYSRPVRRPDFIDPSTHGLAPIILTAQLSRPEIWEHMQFLYYRPHALSNDSLTPNEPMYEDGDGAIDWLLDLDLTTPANDGTLSDPADQLRSRISMTPSWLHHLATLPIVRTKLWLVDPKLYISPVPNLVIELATENRKRSYATDLDATFPRATIDQSKLKTWYPHSHPFPFYLPTLYKSHDSSRYPTTRHSLLALYLDLIQHDTPALNLPSSPQNFPNLCRTSSIKHAHVFSARPQSPLSESVSTHRVFHKIITQLELLDVYHTKRRSRTNEV